MRMRHNWIVPIAVAMVLGTTAAIAQPVSIDKNYEDAKAIEISGARVRLATRPASTGVQELNEAETLLRQLKSARNAETRRKLAAELELAVTRLNLVANGAGEAGR